MKRRHDMPFGAALLGEGQTLFRLWAPSCDKVGLLLGEGSHGRRHEMKPATEGWHELLAADAPPGTRYRYETGACVPVPDPASRLNPQGVHGPSEVVDPLAYRWRHGGWRGKPWTQAVIYELHVGTFTPEGTFASAAGRLAELAALGITAIELMPVAEFPGARNWGYDGVLPFAPHAGYGTPGDLKAFVDAAHGEGLMVLLDVVYNHFGPEGNYLHGYCPQFFNPSHQTPWGAAINFDGDHCRAVRDFFVHNALYWVEEFFLDGLRLDAIHAIHDDSDPDVVREIARALAQGPGSGREVHLVLENDLNQAGYLVRDEETLAPRFATAQWNDDIHHALHVIATGESDGYYADYADAPLERLGRALAEGFVYQGEPSAFRDGELRGSPSAGLPPAAFVAFLQTHDQVGNRAFGERIGTLGSPPRLRVALACLLLSPQPPMFFMGEEYSASTPFLYFCDFGPELAAAVSRGRREEFGRFAAFDDPQARERIPDPGEMSTFERSRLDWNERLRPGHREHLDLVRSLLAIRHGQLAPRLAGMRRGGTFAVADGVLRVSWTLGDGSRWHLAVHFGDTEVHLAEAIAGKTIYRDGAGMDADGLRLGPCAVAVSLEAP